MLVCDLSTSVIAVVINSGSDLQIVIQKFRAAFGRLVSPGVGRVGGQCSKRVSEKGRWR
jgi:hypothetical protein